MEINSNKLKKSAPDCQKQLVICCPGGVKARSLSKYNSCKAINIKCKGRQERDGVGGLILYRAQIQGQIIGGSERPQKHERIKERKEGEEDA